MKCNVLAICDDQSVYAELLTKQLLREEEDLFQICRFSSLAELLLFQQQHEIQCLLISESYEQEMKESKAKRTFFLTDKKMKARIRNDDTEKKALGYIYRYQSAEEIYEILRKGATEVFQNDIDTHMNEEIKPQLIGVYNPVHRNGQTTFAKALAEHYGKGGKRTLYLNMEEYAGITEKDSNSQGDLGEVLYYLKQDIKNINYRLAAFTTQVKHFEMVQPILISRELHNITVEEWISFFTEVMERSGYEIIILDLDSCIQGLFAILEQCDQIYMPIREDCRGEGKRKQFLMNLEKLQKEMVKQKIICAYLTVVDGCEETVEQAVENQVASLLG